MRQAPSNIFDGMTKADIQREKKEFALASSIVDLLTKSYPGFAWSSNVMSVQGVILIRECTLMDEKTPFILRIPEIDHSEQFFSRSVVKAGGEILERFFLTRDPIDAFRANDQKNMLVRNFKDKPIFDAQGISNVIARDSFTVQSQGKG